MADFQSPNIVDSHAHNPFRAWDAFDRLFDEAFSRGRSHPLPPGITSPLSTHFPESHVYSNAGATPYASGSPAGSESSNGSLGLFLGPDDQDRDDPFDAMWNDGLGKTRRSTVTTTKTARRNKRTLESSGSNSTSASHKTSQSSSGLSGSLPSQPPPPVEPVKPPKLKKRKSKVTFRDSTDGKTVTATFDLPGISKSDVHVSYQTDKIVISWESVSIEERTEGNRVIRDRREKRYVRTLPLPEGTKFEQVKASMDDRRLVLTYPKFTARKLVHVIEIKT